MVWPFTSRRGGDPAFKPRKGRGAPARRRAAQADESIYSLPEPFPRRMLRWLRRAGLVAGCLALVGGVAAGGVYVRHFLYRTPYFKIREVRITGASPALEQDARAWLTPRLAHAGSNLVSVDRGQLVGGLTRLPRARQVRVQKVYPDVLQVAFTERQPLVLANLGETYLMDREGFLLAPVKARDIAQLQLPLLSGLSDFTAGPGSHLTMPRLAEVLEAIQFINSSDGLLKDQIREWNMSQQGQVTALLRSGTEVRFGAEPLLDLLPKLSAGLEQKKPLRQAAYIDLRMEHQLVYKEVSARP